MINFERYSDNNSQFLLMHYNFFMIVPFLSAVHRTKYNSDYCHSSHIKFSYWSIYTAPAVMFFVISTFFELLCVMLYAFVFPKLPIVKYYRSKAASEGSKTVSADLAAGGILTSPRGVLFLFFFQLVCLENF